MLKAAGIEPAEDRPDPAAADAARDRRARFHLQRPMVLKRQKIDANAPLLDGRRFRREAGRPRSTI